MESIGGQTTREQLEESILFNEPPELLNYSAEVGA